MKFKHENLKCVTPQVLRIWTCLLLNTSCRTSALPLSGETLTQ